MQIPVMTFNLRYNNPGDGMNAWPNRSDAAAAVIRSHAPLVCGIQEGLHSMLLDLEQRLPEYSWFGKGRDGGKSGEYSAVFYRKDRIELLEQGQFWLSATPEIPASIGWDARITRICTWGLLREASTGGRFLFFNTHLDHVGEAARLHGAALLVRFMKEQRAKWQVPALLTGDMNAVPDSPPIRFLRGEGVTDGVSSDLTDAYLQAGEAIGRTFHGFKGSTEGEPIDYIFASPGFTVLSVKVDRTRPGGRYPSDHYPVIAEVRLG